jgi:HEAT repeat protein
VPRSTLRVRGSAGPAVGGDFTARVVGAEDLAAVAKALRQAGDKDLRKELYRGLRRAVKPLIADARQHARDTLPKAGGLNERVARSKFRVTVRGAGRNPGVRITATGLDRRLDTDGRIRHPVYGNRDAWVQQQVKPHWFQTPMQAGAGEVRRELQRVVDDIAKRLESG